MSVLGLAFSRSTGHNSSFIFSFFKSEMASNESCLSPPFDDRPKAEGWKCEFTPLARNHFLLARSFASREWNVITGGQTSSGRRCTLNDNVCINLRSTKQQTTPPSLNFPSPESTCQCFSSSAQSRPPCCSKCTWKHIYVFSHRINIYWIIIQFQLVSQGKKWSSKSIILMQQFPNCTWWFLLCFSCFFSLESPFNRPWAVCTTKMRKHRSKHYFPLLHRRTRATWFYFQLH